MLSPKSFRYSMAHGIGRITFSRPEKLNSLTFEIYDELRKFFRVLAHEQDVRVVVIGGEGRGFCSGGDVNEIIGPLLERDMNGLLEFTRMTGDLIRAMCQLPKPIIASINGIAAGAGAVIALASDFRVAAASAKIAFLFTKVGLAGADMGAAFLLPRVVGLAHANRLLYLGDSVSGDEALRLGLFHEVVPDDQLSQATDQLAGRLASGPALGQAMTKMQLYAELSMSLDAALEAEAQAQAVCMQHPDFRKAFETFQNRKK